MATIAQGGTIQIQSCSYGGVGHPHTTTDSPQGQSTIRNSLITFLHLTIAFLHLVQKRIIDNIFVHFYLINTLKAPPSSISRTEELTLSPFLRKNDLWLGIKRRSNGNYVEPRSANQLKADIGSKRKDSGQNHISQWEKMAMEELFHNGTERATELTSLKTSAGSTTEGRRRRTASMSVSYTHLTLPTKRIV